jgi:hypothetical protein
VGEQISQLIELLPRSDHANPVRALNSQSWLDEAEGYRTLHDAQELTTSDFLRSFRKWRRVFRNPYEALAAALNLQGRKHALTSKILDTFRFTPNQNWLDCTLSEFSV